MDEAFLAFRLGHAARGLMIGNAGGVVVAEKLDVAAKRNGRHLPARAVPVVEAKQLRAEANGKRHDTDAIPAGNQKMAKLVEEDHDGQHKQKRYDVAEDAPAERAQARQKIKAHDAAVPAAPLSIL